MRFLYVLALLLSSSAALTAPIPEYPFVFTAGSAETQIAPDTASLQFTVSAGDLDGTSSAQRKPKP